MNVWTIPNLVTMTRIAVLPLVVFLLWPGIENRETTFWAAVAFGLSGATDFIDGYLARNLKQVSVFGKFLDPLADKLFYLVTMVALLQLPGPRIPFIVVMLVLIRELSITGLRAIASSEGVVIAAGQGGKTKTVFGTVGMILLILHYEYPIDFGFATATINFHRVGLWLTYISLAYSLTSAFSYIRGFSKALDEQRSGNAPAA
ncbi:MAG: CDP-diacylglycerol--glycerol-3-phosphate 3-phosphatidyltransferase [Myxococcota bacterium]